MAQALELIALMLVAAAWAFALAHAAEYPGKMRLGRESYLAAQTIYYPGFTIGGASEPLAALALIALLVLTPSSGAGFKLIALSLAATIATHAIFWLVTQPVNRVWAKLQPLSAASERFFATGREASEGDWTRLRDRWERSHLWRALLMSVGLVALAAALTIARP